MQTGPTINHSLILAVNPNPVLIKKVETEVDRIVDRIKSAPVSESNTVIQKSAIEIAIENIVQQIKSKNN